MCVEAPAPCSSSRHGPMPASCTCHRCPAASMNRLYCAFGQKPRDASQFIAVRVSAAATEAEIRFASARGSA